MATVIQIKRTTGVSAPTVSDLAEAELAYVQDRSNDGASSKLFIESVDSGANPVVHEVGGKYFTDIIKGDFIPQGSVLNQLRRHYELPELSGDYGLGCMSVQSDVLYELEDKEEKKENEKEEKEKEEKEKEKRDIEMYNFCDITLTSIGIVLFSRWLIKKMEK